MNDSKTKIEKDLKDEGLPYPVCAGKGTDVIKDYKIHRTPTLVIIDKAGKIQSSSIFMQYNAMKDVLDELTAAGEKTEK